MFKKIFLLANFFLLAFNCQSSFASDEIKIRLEKSTDKKPFLVRVVSSQSQDKTGKITVFGTTEHIRTINLKPETGGRIEKILFSEGDKVKKGDVIAKIAMDNRQQMLKKAQAGLSKTELEYKVAKSLLKSGHRSETKLAEALANLRSARSELSGINLDIKYTDIIAPFDGMIQQIMVEEGDIIKTREGEIATIIDYSSSLAVGYIPEQKISYIKKGDVAFVTNSTGYDSLKEGKIKFVSQVADSETRTFKVEVETPFDGEITKEGLTAKINIPTKSYQAHLISSSYLSLNENGDIGIKTVDSENQVKFNKINIVDEDSEGLWVVGLPIKIKIITLGQAYVSDGEIVAVAVNN